MRKITALTLLATVCSFMYGQFDLTSARMPQVGDKQYYHFADTLGYAPGPAGTGQTWDFSTLSDSSGPFYAEILSKSDAPNGNSYPNANMALDDGNQNFTFLNSQPAQLTVEGYQNDLTLGSAAAHTDPGIKFNLPSAFGASVTDSFAGTYFALAANVHRKGEMITEIDAAGDITLPNGLVHNNVIRVRHEIHIKDSANVFGQTVISTSSTVFYSWYDSTRSLPVFVSKRVNGDALGNQIADFLVYYAAIDTTVGIEEVSGPVANAGISPNPFGNTAVLKFELSRSGELSAQLIDMTGRVVQTLADGRFGAGRHSLIVDGEGLKPGVYFLRLQHGNAVETRKLVHF